MTRDFVRTEGLFVGGSCGAAVAGALKYARASGKKENILVVLPAKLAELTTPGGRVVRELDQAKLSALPARVVHRILERVAPRYGYTLSALRLDELDALAASGACVASPNAATGAPHP